MLSLEFIELVYFGFCSFFGGGIVVSGIDGCCICDGRGSIDLSIVGLFTVGGFVEVGGVVGNRGCRWRRRKGLVAVDVAAFFGFTSFAGVRLCEFVVVFVEDFRESDVVNGGFGVV